MSIFEFIQSATSNIWTYGGSFILVLSLLVFIHEWGHYIVARLCGVRVEVFSIGFGREVAGRDDSHGTRWKFSLIPLGGYVKLFGDVDPASAKSDDSVADSKTGKKRRMTKAEREVAFFNKPLWKRAAIVFAGPAINYIFAIIIMSFLFSLNGKPVTPPVGAAVIVGSSAEENGFEPHDEILSIDGRITRSFEDIRREMTIALDQERHFVIRRGDQTLDIYARPHKEEITDHFGFTHSRGLLGLVNTQLAVDTKRVKSIEGHSYEEGQHEAILAEFKKRMGTSFKITLHYGDKDETLIVHPLASFNEHIDTPDHKYNGILVMGNTTENNFIKYPPLQAVGKSLQETWNITTGTLEAMGQMITGVRPASELGGIIRIGAIAGDMAQQGIIALIMFTALLSINLGLINLFPVPLLDGGHLVFYAIEGVMGRPVPEKVQDFAFQAGMVFLIAIMAFANINDIIQLVLKG